MKKLLLFTIGGIGMGIGLTELMHHLSKKDSLKNDCSLRDFVKQSLDWQKCLGELLHKASITNKNVMEHALDDEDFTVLVLLYLETMQEETLKEVISYLSKLTISLGKEDPSVDKVYKDRLIDVLSTNTESTLNEAYRDEKFYIQLNNWLYGDHSESSIEYVNDFLDDDLDDDLEEKETVEKE